MSRSSALLIAALVLLPGGANGQAPTQRLEVTDHQTVEATIRYEMQARNCVVTRWTAFFPDPPELPSQGRVKTTTSPASKVMAEKSLLARKVRMVDVPVAKPAPGGRLAVRIDINATLRSRKLVSLAGSETPPTVALLSASEKKYYSAPSPTVDFDAKPFQKWLDEKSLRRATGGSPLELATRTLEVLRADFVYRYDALEKKQASAVCGRTGTDCGGMTNLFVGVMRANDIPARMLVGRLALPRKPGSTSRDWEYDRPHARAEVYVVGIGWVPVDPAYAVAAKEKPVTAFLGDDPGDLLVLHVDLDLRLPFPDRERTADLLQLGGYVWATGRGDFDGAPNPNGWDVTTTLLGER
jgi:transglutaminase-like putative cysteine protease